MITLYPLIVNHDIVYIVDYGTIVRIVRFDDITKISTTLNRQPFNIPDNRILNVRIYYNTGAIIEKSLPLNGIIAKIYREGQITKIELFYKE